MTTPARRSTDQFAWLKYQLMGLLTLGVLAPLAADEPAHLLTAPKLILADGSAHGLVPAGAEGDAELFRGADGSPVAGVAVRRAQAGEAVTIELTSTVALRDVQLVQEVRLPLDWRSYVIAPGALYDGNRFIVSPQPYAPYLLTEGVNPEGPVVIADIPRLTSDRGYRVELAANALAIPVVGAFDRSAGRGYLVGVDVYGAWGTTGVNLRTPPGEPVAVEVTLPVRRAQRYRFCDWIKADEVGVDLAPGTVLLTRLTLQPVAAASIPAFVTRVAEYGAATRGAAPRMANPGLRGAARLIEAKLNAHNWDEAEGYYTSTMDNAWKLQTGWVGGGVTFYALAGSEDPATRRRALRMMDTICRNGLAGAGYFHGLHKDGRWQSFGAKRPGCRAFSLVRRPLECTRDVLKTLELLRQRGEAIDPVWADAARRNLEAIVRTTERHGQLGYTVDFETGEVLWGGSATGAFALEPLVRGAAWFGEPRYLATAERLAEYYVTHFVERGYTCGGVGDALMAVDSESNYALLAGLMRLHAATGRARYLDWARATADLFATWVLSYDAQLPPDSPLGRLGVQARGAVFANTQNQHGAPGICTASGRALLELHEATGEERYLRLLEDIATAAPQLVVQPGQDWLWGDLPVGSVSERLMTMDGMERNGHTARISTWAEIAILHMARELPPEYRDPRSGRAARFDVPR